MKLEINLWYNSRGIKGRLNINNKESVENFSLLKIDDFYKYTIDNNCCDKETLEEFLGDNGRDRDALYAWTDSGSVVWWNSRNKFAEVIFKQEYYRLPQNTKIHAYKNSPDICFRV